MKKSKRLLVLLLVLLLLVGALWGVQKYNEKQDEVAEEGIKIVDIAEEDIVRFSYDYNGETHSFEKENDTWHYTADSSLEVTQYVISNMLSKVSPLTAEVVIEDVADMAQYGFGEEVRTIHYETEKASYIFEVGDCNSVSGVYYIRKPADTVVYAVDASVVTAFNKERADFITETEQTEETQQAE